MNQRKRCLRTQPMPLPQLTRFSSTTFLLLVGFFGAWIPCLAQVPPTYLSAGDTLEVVVYRDPDLSRNYTVSPEGKINFPMVGEIIAQGMDVEQLTAELTRKYSRYFRNPQIVVNFGKMTWNKVYVSGQVHQPGAFTWSKGLKLTAYLGAAGGVTQGARLQGAVIRREEGGQVRRIPVDLRKVLLDGDASQNLELQPGDTLFVPYGSDKVYLSGEVKNPGAYDYIDGMRLADAMGLAGGPLHTSDLTQVRITRPGSSGSETTTVNLVEANKRGDPSKNPPLDPGDVIFIPEAPRVYVVGEVQRPGAFDYQEGFRVRHYAALAGGPTNLGETRKATLTTMQDGLPVTRTIDLQNVLENAASDQNFVVNVGDSIYVPRKTDRVYVSGEVVKPGDFEIRQGFRITDYVGLAGGSTIYANSRETLIIRSINGKSQQTKVDLLRLLKGQDPEKNLVLGPGDMVVVSGRFIAHRIQDYGPVGSIVTSLALLLRVFF